jgi:toxin FitB
MNMASQTSFKWLLDTNVISELSRLAPHPGAYEWLAANIKQSVLSGVSVGELEYGVQRMTLGVKKRFMQSWLDNMVGEFGVRIWSVDMPTWREYGRLKRELELLGRPQDDFDLLIAATAITHRLTLVTRNTKHFEDTGCELLNPWQDIA